MKKLRIVLAIILLLGAVSAYSFIDKTNNIYDAKIDSSEFINTGAILEGTEIVQQFVSKEDRMSGLQIKGVKFGDPQEVKIRYSLKDLEENKIVAQGYIKGSEIKSGKFCKIEFEELLGCKEKKFEITVTSKKAISENAIAISLQETTENKTKLSVNQQEISGTLIMRTVVHRFDFETFIVVLFLVLYVICFTKILYKLFK